MKKVDNIFKGSLMLLFTILTIFIFVKLMNGQLFQIDEDLRPITSGFFGFVIAFCVYFTYVSFQRKNVKRGVEDLIEATNKKYKAINDEIEKELRNMHFRKENMKIEDERDYELAERILREINELEVIKIQNTTRKIREIEDALNMI